MQQLNEMLLAVINASAEPSAILVSLARILAEWMIYAVALVLIWGWLRGGKKRRRQLVIVGLTIIIALLVNMLFAAVWYHPRPFAIGIGNQLLAHAADNSFPSDHATVMFAVAFGLIAARMAVVWSGPALLLAFGVAWSRVYLGVHWPLDMAGSFAVALAASWIARIAVATKTGRNLSDLGLKSYDFVLKALHIPASVSPRSLNAD